MLLAVAITAAQNRFLNVAQRMASEDPHNLELFQLVPTNERQGPIPGDFFARADFGLPNELIVQIVEEMLQGSRDIGDWMNRYRMTGGVINISKMLRKKGIDQVEEQEALDRLFEYALRDELIYHGTPEEVDGRISALVKAKWMAGGELAEPTKSGLQKALIEVSVFFSNEWVQFGLSIYFYVKIRKVVNRALESSQQFTVVRVIPQIAQKISQKAPPPVAKVVGGLIASGRWVWSSTRAAFSGSTDSCADASPSSPRTACDREAL